jgi:CubicO group peptidase (beta-lactamase class C family)
LGITLCLIITHPMHAGNFGSLAELGTDAAQLTSKLAADLDTYLQRCATFGFSGGVLVVSQGQVVLCQGYGLADRARGIPFRADTAFDIGSVTKQFTAAAILKLETLGKLRIEEPINKYLAAVPADKDAITVQHLLTHTAGLRRDGGGRERVVSRDDVVAQILASKLISEPGKKYGYSNDGYTLLAAVIEKASGQTFQSFLRQQIFDPLGMAKTGFYGDAGRWEKETVARSYTETAPEVNPLDWPLTWAATGNGHVISTLPDMARWERELRGGDFLSADAKRKMFAPHVDVEGPLRYGYGWFVRVSAQGKKLCYHPGFYRSFGTEYRRYIDDDITTIVASNQGYLGGTGQQVALADPVARLAHGKDQPLPPPATTLNSERLAKYCGTFRLPSGSRLEFHTRDGQFEVEAVGQDAFDLLVAPDEERSRMFAKCNTQAAAMIEAAKTGDRDALKKSIGEKDTEAFSRVMDPGWSSLVKQFGPLGRYTVLGTAPYPFNDDWIRTYARLEFERASVVVTFGYRDGGFFDLSTWEGVANPGALIVACLSEPKFTTYSLWTGKGTAMEFHSGPNGKFVGVNVVAQRHPVTAVRVD